MVPRTHMLEIKLPSKPNEVPSELPKRMGHSCIISFRLGSLDLVIIEDAVRLLRITRTEFLRMVALRYAKEIRNAAREQD